MNLLKSFCFGISLCMTPLLAGSPSIDINEVYYLGASGEDWIEFKNVGAGTVNISSYWICARFGYSQLSTLTLLDGTDLNLDPGEFATVQVNFDLNNTSSDIGLYSDNNFGSSSSMVDFVQYGTSADVGRPDVAAPDLWTEISMGVYDFVATAAAGQSLSFDGTNDGGAATLLSLSSDFANGTQTRSAENFNIPVELMSFSVD